MSGRRRSSKGSNAPSTFGMRSLFGRGPTTSTPAARSVAVRALDAWAALKSAARRSVSPTASGSPARAGPSVAGSVAGTTRLASAEQGHSQSSTAPPPCPSTAGMSESPYAPPEAASPTTEDEFDEIEEERPKKKKKAALANNTVPPSERMNTFLDGWAKDALDALLASEAGPTPHEVCQKCAGVTEEWLRCYDCYHAPVVCRTCFVAEHGRNPFHRVQSWKQGRRYWKRKVACVLSPKLNLGHSGDSCPNASHKSQGISVAVVHEHGVDEVKIQYCRCVQPGANTAMAEPLQLIRFGLFPASWKAPRSAFTLHAMEDFHLLSHQSQVNAHDYMMYLRRCKDNMDPDGVTDRYREFLTANREFAYLTAVKRVGETPGRNKEPGSLSALCPACPDPSINMRPDWKEYPPEKKFLHAMFHSVDGNFHAKLKQKPMDENDLPLTLGAAYFANQKEVDTYLSKVPSPRKERSTCHQFGAMGYGTYKGKVSGTVGLSCARHMFVLPGGGVDLQKGERFANVDFAHLSGLQRYCPLHKHVSCYDINCQYRINFHERLKWVQKKNNLDLFPSLKTAEFPPTVSGVGKFHLPAHIASCRYKFSFNFLPGVGMTDGEAPERIWAQLNGLAKSTSEMTPGHRHDAINDFHSDMNTRRTHALSKKTYVKHTEAVEQHQIALETLKTVEGGLPHAKLKKWREVEAKWLEDVVDIKKHKNLKNPYEPDKGTALTQKQVLATLSEGMDEENPEFAAAEPGIVRAIAEGMYLETFRQSLLSKWAKPKEGERTALNDLKDKFMARVDAWRTLYGEYIRPHIEDAQEALPDVPTEPTYPAHEDEDEDEEEGANDEAANTGGGQSNSRKRKRKEEVAPSKAKTKPHEWYAVNAVQLDLPSRYPRIVLEQDAMVEVTRVEKRLREGEAYDTLELLRMHLLTKTASIKDKTAGSGQKWGGRANAIIHSKQEAIDAAAIRYRDVRTRLLRLGMDKEDKVYRQLKKADIASFVVYTSQQKLGDSRRKPSWIWTNYDFIKIKRSADLENYCAEQIKVYWFRCSALRTHWREEVELLEEEMDRIMRSFLYFKSRWEAKAKADDHAVKDGAAAYARKQAARYRRLLTQAGKHFRGIISLEEFGRLEPEADSDVEM